MILRNRT